MAKIRKVRGLVSVEMIPPPGNRRGGTNDFAPSSAAGLRYERHFGMYLGAKNIPYSHGQWLKFSDLKGTNYAQPDYISELEDRVYIWENKLTQKAEGELKLEKLYVPLVRALFPDKAVFPVMVFRNILWQPDRLFDSIDAVLLLRKRDSEKISHLHWIGL